MKTQLAAGIDIGGTNTIFGLVDQTGKIHERGHLSTLSYPTAETLVDAIAEKINDYTDKHRSALELIGAGAGVPNGNFFSGCIEYAPNLKWKGVIPLASYFETRLSCPAFLTNDAKAAALGELLFGGATGLNDFLFITLGTGLGCGLVSNGELVYGHDGMAGELGHTVFIPDGRLCGCGRKGCLETYCSASGIKKTYLELTGLPHTPEIDARFIYEKALDGQKEALDSFYQTGKWLGLALANYASVTGPSDIFLFGGLAQAGDLIFLPVKKYFELNLLQVFRNKINIRRSLLPENDAPVLGAASLAWKHLKKGSSE